MCKLWKRHDSSTWGASYTKKIEGEVTEWVATNIEKWQAEQPGWFDVKSIPDKFLPLDVLEEEGGEMRERKGGSVRESLRS